MFQPSADLGRRRSNSELIREHEKAVDSGIQDLGQDIVTNITSWGDRKTADDFPCVPPIADLLPIRVATLEPNTTHRQRVLRGTIAVKKPTVAAAAGTLLQDEDGNLVKLWLYNLVPMSHSGETDAGARRQNWEAALSMLPQGQALAIIEPFYKVMSDGSLGIRVDNPAEVIFLDSLNRQDAATWRDQGTTLFRSQHYDDALWAYSKALQHQVSGAGAAGAGAAGGGGAGCGVGGGALLTSLLLNSSACLLALGRSHDALAAAAAAICLEPHLAKGYYRAALATDALLQHGAAYKLMEAAAGAQVEAQSRGGQEEGGWPSRRPRDKSQGQVLGGLLTQLSQAARAQGPRQSKEQQQTRYQEASDFGETSPLISTLVCDSVMRVLVGQPGAHIWEVVDVGSDKELGGAEVATGLKEAGNILFRGAKHEEALSAYQAALGALKAQRQATTTLLCNQSTCHLRLSGTLSLRSACVYACAALTLDGSNPKAHHRRTNALLQLSWLDAAAEAAQAGAARLTGDAAAAQEVAELGKRIQAALDARADAAVRSKPKDGKSPDALASASHTSATPSATFSGSGSYAASGQSASKRGGTSKEPATERELAEILQRGMAEVEEVAALNNMMTALQSMTAHGSNKVPSSQTSDNSMHLAYRYPPQVDVKQAQRLLQTAYENRRGLPMRTEFMLNWSAERILESERHQLIKRLGGNDKESFEWYFTAQIGSTRTRTKTPYNSTVIQSFSNVPVRSEVLTPGTCHVAIGFADLGGLAASLTLWPEEVCYSSAWKASTRTTFRTALSSLTNQARTSKSRGSKGQAGRVPPQSRRMWMESVNAGYIGSVANFKRKVDRLALCSYIVTGQLLEAEVGSTVMFAVPRHFGELALDEKFLQTLSTSEIFGEMKKHQERDIIGAGVELLRFRMERLGRFLRAGHVQVDVWLANLTPENKNLQEEIRQLKPWTVSWSNVPDYVDTAAFHRMARQLSGAEDTVHYAHSMNWPVEVKGASYLDFLRGDESKEKVNFEKVVTGCPP
eukprot:gene29353-12439_t